LVIGVVFLAGNAQAGQATTAPGVELPSGFSGLRPPVLPATVTRDELGRTIVRAIRLTQPLRVDGRLDESVYSTVEPISDFIQNDPQAGAPGTEKTELWVTFDDAYVYVSFRCWESQPERLIANEMRRDNQGVFRNDNVAFMFDTFYDRRNSILFNINPIGGRMDGQVTNEQQNNGDWNPVWDLEVGRFENGWTVEAAVPFKSLRYRPGRAQIWGFNARRNNLWKNEYSFLTRVPAGRGPGAIFLASLAATLVGIEAPPPSRNLEVKPYVTSDLTSDLTASPRISNDPGADAGVDVKYGVTQNLTANFTYNTDFAQVEADEQQINLTRFSLFFPEKREFFLENQGLFAFGGASAVASAGDTPVLFYSRRIGLNEGRETPILAGGRLTGRLGRYSLGVLNIQTDDEPVSRSLSTNFSALRVKRDLLRRSSIGLLVTGRSIGQSGSGSNQAYGVDGTFAFFDSLAINTYWARTQTDALSGEDTSYRAQLNYNGDRYGVQLERLVVGDSFNPEIGFVRRDDMRSASGELRFSPRLASSRVIRKLSWSGSLAYIENGARRLESRDLTGEFAIDFHNSDRFFVDYTDSYEFLPAPFRIASGITLPVGGYDFRAARAGMNFGRQRPISTNISAEYGTFYSGHRTTFAISQGRLNPSPRISIEPTYSVNAVDLREGSFTTILLGSRATFTVTPLMFISALVQHNSGNRAVTANVRLRWEYQPGSELFVVWNEQRDTRLSGFPGLVNRGVIVKVNRLFRF
jgi:hypothetical protein